MPRRGKRTRLERGISEDATGRTGRVTVGAWHREKRFPPRTPLQTIRNWRHETRQRLGGLTRTTARGTLVADVARYLTLVQHLAGWVSLRSELRAWTTRFPALRRHQLTAGRVLDTRNAWLQAGVAPKTINNRVDALRRLWHRLDGRRAPTPCDEIAPLATHKTPPVVIAADLVRTVYANLLAREARGVLRTAKTRARFMVMASTGKRPSEIVRAEPGDVDLTRRVWTVRDGKGGWSPGIYLNDDMLAAWQTFIAADAWGYFRESALVKTLHAAGWPLGRQIGPYQLRHTVGITMSEGGVDLADIQQHLGHKRIETTRRHYVPVLGSRLQRASERVDGRFGWTPAKGHGE